jgi:hypothetical protein
MSEDGPDPETDGADAPSSGKWICAWCEKPHDRNDPPCDNCGHHKFEKAVVPVAPESTDHDREPVWVCPECGRQHQKNSPPCSRCGHASLERRIPDDDGFAEELGGTSYFDVLEPIYLVAIVFAVVAGGALLLGLLGVISLPGMGGDSLAVSNVPGNATTAEGLSLAEVEEQYVVVANEQLTQDTQLTRNDRLDDVARFYNQRRVKAAYGDGSVPNDERLREAIGDACGSQPGYLPFDVFRDGGLSAFESERAVAERLVGDSPPEGSSLGIDVHALPDGGLSVTYFVC